MKKVSGYTHTKTQMNHYSNQKNPNSKAFRADQSNHDRQVSGNNNKIGSNKQ